VRDQKQGAPSVTVEPMPALIRSVIMTKEIAVHSTLGYRSPAEFEARATGSQSGVDAQWGKDQGL
jgi:hypothetical protein